MSVALSSLPFAADRPDIEGQVAAILGEGADPAVVGALVELVESSALPATDDRFAALSLEQLISGHERSVEEVLERAATFGWDLARPRAVLLASVDPPVEPVVADRALATIAAAARATLGPDAIVWRRSATIAALITADDQAPEARRELAEAMQRELDQRLRSVSVSIGVGRLVETPHLLARSFTEASRAVDVGRWAKGRHVAEVFDELGLERLLAPTSADDLADFVEATIGPLVRHDADHGTHLVETLRVWLEERNLASAARRLGVHYNTMRNRLDRIEEIMGPVLDNPARVLECEVAVYVRRHHLGPTAGG
jgi:purine catabolism regulator